ncbi:MAG: 50S ribosomal protein L32e [Candidatus Bathyarchaeia archaeon]
MKEPKPTTAEKLLEIRRRVKAKKPNFVRQESWRYKRLKENWRKPKGIDNKMRRKIKGWPPTANTGYRGPKAARGLHPSGYEEVLIYNVDDLKKVDPKTQAIKIAHTVGKKKRAQILTEAKKKHMVILNVKEIKEEKAPEEKKVATEEAKQKKRKPRKKSEGEQEGDDAA